MYVCLSVCLYVGMFVRTYVCMYVVLHISERERIAVSCAACRKCQGCSYYMCGCECYKGKRCDAQATTSRISDLAAIADEFIDVSEWDIY